MVYQKHRFLDPDIVCVWLTLNSLSDFPVLPFPQAPAGLQSNATVGLYTSKNYSPNPHAGVIPWLALFHLGCVLRSWGVSPPKRGVFDEKWRNRPNLIGACFYKVLDLHQRKQRKTTTMTKTPRPWGVLSSYPLSQMGSFWDQGLAEVRHKPWFAFLPKSLPQGFRLEGGYLCDIGGSQQIITSERIRRDTNQ